MHDIGEKKADAHREARGEKIEHDGLATDGADTLDVLQGDDACHHGDDDERNDDHLDEVQEDGADRLDIRIRKSRIALQKEPAHHA